MFSLFKLSVAQTPAYSVTTATCVFEAVSPRLTSCMTLTDCASFGNQLWYTNEDAGNIFTILCQKYQSRTIFDDDIFWSMRSYSKTLEGNTLSILIFGQHCSYWWAGTFGCQDISGTGMITRWCLRFTKSPIFNLISFWFHVHIGMKYIDMH